MTAILINEWLARVETAPKTFVKEALYGQTHAVARFRTPRRRGTHVPAGRTHGRLTRPSPRARAVGAPPSRNRLRAMERQDHRTAVRMGRDVLLQPDWPHQRPQPSAGTDPRRRTLRQRDCRAVRGR